MSRQVSIIAVLCLSLLSYAQADTGSVRSIKVTGRESITVTTPVLRLGDVAEVSSAESLDDEVVIGLQKIYLERSPAPGRELTLSAASVLETLGTQGIDLKRITYTFPRIMTVRRAGRPVSAQEVRDAIERAMQSLGADVAIKEVRYQEGQLISPGTATIEASTLPVTIPGLRSFSINAIVDGEKQPPFTVSASVEEWGMMPVAKRTVSRGSLIAADDVVMARVNLAALPGDALRKDEDVIGLEVNRDISFGEIFRKEKLTIPPLVTAGAKVTMLYRRGPFEATATGIALESGVRGQEIKIKNETSKKVVSGVVLEPGIIGVKP